MIFRGLFDRLRGRPVVDGERVFLIENTAFAARIDQPEQPVWGKVTVAPCERCGRALEERVITSALPSDAPDAFDQAPIAVDGWACERCGIACYPRPHTPERITSFGRRGAELSRAGKPKEAGWWFTRITWDWPSWAPGHLDLAQSLRAYAERERERDAPDGARAIRRRARDAYLAAIDAATRTGQEHSSTYVATARIGLAEIAIEEWAIPRAREAVAACLALEGLDPSLTERVREIQQYLDEERYIFGAATEMLSPFIRLQGRPVRRPEGAERETVSDAIARLEAYAAARPTHWQSKWFVAMGLAALDEDTRTMAAWRTAWDAHREQPAIVREYGMALIRRGEFAEAQHVSRDSTTRVPDDGTLWCNRAVAELLAGDLESAQSAVAQSRTLDPADPIARALENRLQRYRNGAPLPRSLEELERSG